MDLSNNIQNEPGTFQKGAGSSRYYGVYPALVVDLKDGDSQGRIKVKLPWVSDDPPFEVWARLATLMAGNNRGTWFIPDIDDEVLVAFEGGNLGAPYVIGSLWNGADSPPESMDGMGRNFIKLIRSRDGIQIKLDETDVGKPQIILETPGGKKLTLKDPEKITIEDDFGNKVEMNNKGINISSSGMITLDCNALKISASLVDVDAGVSKFSGVINTDTLIANSVVSSSYTPGAGNIW